MSSSLEADLQQVLARAWKTYKILSKGPSTLQPLCITLLSMIANLRMIHEVRQECHLSVTDRDTLFELCVQCDADLNDVDTALKNLASRPSELSTVVNLHSSFESQTKRLASFLENLHQSCRRQALFKALEKITALEDEEHLPECITDWDTLLASVTEHGLSRQTVEEEFFFIKDFLQKRLPDDQQLIEEEKLPDYSPNGHRERENPTEKGEVQNLDEATRRMTLDDSSPDMLNHSFLPEHAPLESPKAEPPPYTFDSGTDETIDEDFVKHIHLAVDNESRRRFEKHQRHPSLGPHPYSWLPQYMQAKFANVSYLIPSISADSFTAMARETAPHCVTQVEYLEHLIRVSFEHKFTTVPESVVSEAPNALRIMSIALSKFGLLQDQRSHDAVFTDLDTLDFEHSTVLALDHQRATTYPEAQLELARKSYYSLLTYTMGLLSIFNSIFEGRTYLTRLRDEIEALWCQHQMSLRVAWISKQLAGWDIIEAAVNQCRIYRYLHPTIRDQAIIALNNWKEAESVICGASGTDTIELTVMSASGLPRSSFRQLSAYVRIVLYGPNPNFTWGSLRTLELRTDVAKSNQNPIWNKTFVVELPVNAKFLDLEVYDRVAGLEKWIGKRRLEHSSVPGVEYRLANRDLLDCVDEEIEFPMKLPVDAKGKEKEPAIIKVKLKWQGRYARVEGAGLPTMPPGKMFRMGHIIGPR